MTPSLVLPLAERDHLQGPMDAPIQFLEYGDYQCPHCGQAYPIVKQIQARLGARLCFAFRNFPLAQIHEHAEHAAEAAEAAGAQGRFWEMHDILFENQEALDDDALAGYARDLGLDARRLIEEVQRGAHSARVREDFKSGARGGVNGTPTFFLNGLRYEGALNAASIVAAVEGQV